jgi:hypothetical protein
MTMTSNPATWPKRRPAKVPIGGSNRRRRRHGRKPTPSAAERYLAARRADAIRNGMPRTCALTREEAAAQQFAKMAGA